MFRKSHLVLIIMGLMVLAACAPASAADEMPNPASVFCGQNGGKLELRQDVSGGAAGICVFSDGSECDEWAYFRSECKPGDSLSGVIPSAPSDETEPSPIAEVEIASDGWKVYRNAELGYIFFITPRTQKSSPMMSRRKASQSFRSRKAHRGL